MQTQIIDSGLRNRIQALVSDAGEIRQTMRSAARRAAQEKVRRDKKQQQAQDEQDAREARLDNIIAEATAGLAALIELAQIKEVKKLILARRSANWPTPICKVGDQHTDVRVYLEPGQVKLVIMVDVTIPRERPLLPRNKLYKIERVYPFDSKDPIAPDPFWHLFYSKMFDEGWWRYDTDNLEEPVYETRGTGDWAAGEISLTEFSEFDVNPLFLEDQDDVFWEADEVNPGWVLLRFLADCNEPSKLKFHLERALKSLK